MNLLNFEDLYRSMELCRNGVMWKSSVSSYYMNGIERTLNLERQLSDETYSPLKPRCFTIKSPKEREIVGIAFRDRVYQRAFNDNILYPKMSKSYIYDNCACQVNKGTDFARNRLTCFMQKFYRKYGVNGYILQCDIKGYYPNMQHDLVEKLFKSKLNEDEFSAVRETLHHQYSGDVGYNPGSQMIQIAGLTALNGLDHYIKEKLRVKYYLRYMDDFVLISNDKEFLEQCRIKIDEELSKIGFWLHPDKTNFTHSNKESHFLVSILKLRKLAKF